MRVYFNKNKVKQGKIICKWFIITYLRSCFTLFHYFTPKIKSMGGLSVWYGL